MILFTEDWRRYPTAVPDFNTKNKSWLKFAYILKGMGVKNHLFHLSVLDPRVLTLDPHSENLTNIEKTIILRECKGNPWYAFREVLRVPAQSGKEAGHFRANKANICVFWLFFNHITCILVMLRQRGKSLSMDMITIYLLELAGKDLTINGSTKDDALRATNIRRLRDIDKELPKWLQKQTRLDSRNLEEFTVVALGNRIRYTLPQKSKKLAELAGRGSTAEIYLGDEIAFQANISISLPAALAAGLAAREIAAEVDGPYGTILSTTAGSRDDPDGKYCYNLMMESSTWSETLYDCKNREELSKVVIGTSIGAVERVAATFYHHQLGISDAWMEKAQKDLMLVGDAALRDLYSVWTHSSSKHPLDSKVLNRISHNSVPPAFLKIYASNGYVIRWYINEEEIEKLKERPFILELDTSDAIGSDDIGMCITDYETGAVLGAGTYNRLNIISFSEWIFQFMMEFPKSVGIIERRSTGSAVLDYLILAFVKHGISPFRRLYNTYVQFSSEKPDDYEKVIQFESNMRGNDLHIRNKKVFGFATSGGGLTSRTALYSDVLTSYATMCGTGVRDAQLISQITGLMVRNGRIDHGEDGNDDLCIAWLLGGFFLLKGRGINHYGLNASRALASSYSATKSKEVKTDADVKQHEIRAEIQRLAKVYQNTHDPLRIASIKYQLRALDSRLVMSVDEHFNLDAVLEDMDSNKVRIDMLSSRNFNNSAPARNLTFHSV